MVDELIARGQQTEEFPIVDSIAGLERALAALRPVVPIQRCTVPKHRNRLARAREALPEGLFPWGPLPALRSPPTTPT